jgi:hypothetical protein
MKTMLLGASLLATLGVTGCAMAPAGEAEQTSAGSTEQALGTTITLSSVVPKGVLVDDDLSSVYFTGRESSIPSNAAMWRVSKFGYAAAQIIHREATSPGSVSFGNLAHRTINGTGWIYFVVNFDDGTGPRSQIKRLNGNVQGTSDVPATVVVDVPHSIGQGELATDETSIYWGDTEGVHKAPLAGGAMTTLTTIRVPAVQLRLDGTSAYFTDYLAIWRVSKSGGEPVVKVMAPHQVSAFDVDSAHHLFYWGEALGAIRSRDIDHGPTVTYEPSDVDMHPVSSLGFDGSRIVWIECASSTSCAVKIRSGGVTSALPTHRPHHLQWDATGAYWGDSYGVRKRVY